MDTLAASVTSEPTEAQTAMETPQAQSAPQPSASHPLVDANGEPLYTNRLINETSPYLLQHAHNPVDWYAWGPEAFDAAKAQDKMIFLSIGYSTCYWCHVMERESFENVDIAKIMNENYICIKVDREERPDVDDIYMSAVQALNNGRGGWPMSLFLVPDGLKPFIGGTYFPPTDQGQRPGFPNVLKQIANHWKTDRPRVLQQSGQVAQFVVQNLSAQLEPVELKADVVQRAVDTLFSKYDRLHAGYGAAPKFPMSANLDFLMATAWDQQPVRDSILHTLDRMATGGMYDQVGGGFHRYSTDARWLVPHFEKMLYDNGQLARTYALAYERTEDAFYAEITREILDYVINEMTGEDGGFYSAQDAEVDAHEGLNYIWTADEFKAVLGEAGFSAEDIAFAAEVYGISGGTNFTDPHHREDGAKNVIFLVDRPDKLAAKMQMDLDAFNVKISAINAALLVVRDTREQPRLDDKVLAAWNGLMIAGFAEGGRVLDEPRYIDAATHAAEFLLTEMRSDDGGLLRSHRAGNSKIDGFGEDYGMVIFGLLALHRATDEARWLDEAVTLADIVRTRFWDAGSGGYFDTLVGQSDLFVRTRSTYDGAVPCANSLMLNNLLDLHELTGESRYLDDAASTLASLSAVITRAPQGTILSTLALSRMIESYPETIGLVTEEEVAAVEVFSTQEPKPFDASNPVQVSADTKSVALALGDRTTVKLTIEIGGKYHINAHEPGIDFLIPLSVEVTNGEGLAVEIVYPDGERYEAAAIADEPMFVYEGKIEVSVIIERTGEISSLPRIAVTYQACTDSTCLMPKTEVLPVVIEGK